MPTTGEPVAASPTPADDHHAGPGECGRVVERYRDLALARLGEEIDRIVLYGSRARGDWHRDSDWDVAVFFRHPVTAIDQRRVSDIGYDVMCETGAVFQSIALPAERWLANDEFIRNMRREGMVVHG